MGTIVKKPFERRLIVTPGLRAGKLTVVGDSGKRDKNTEEIIWECICDCGVTVYESTTGLRRNKKSCINCWGAGDIESEFLEDRLFDPKFDLVFIGFTTYSQKRVMLTQSGVWVGYDTKKREPVVTVKFRNAVGKALRLSKSHYTHMISIAVLFDAVHTLIKSPPKILVSSKKAVDFVQKGMVRWLPIEQKEKSKFYYYMDTYTPVIEAYDAMLPPFSIMREWCLDEEKRLREKLALKQCFDWSELSEIEALQPDKKDDTIIIAS